MTLDTVSRLLDRLLEDKEGSDGFWHGQRSGVTIYVVADEAHDRIRIMAPIGEMRKADPGFLSILLQANFDRALDAKYAMRKRELWSVFMHPMSTLAPDDLGTFMDQVAKLVQNTGTTYASSELIFGVDDETDAELDQEYDVDIDDSDDGDDDNDEDSAAAAGPGGTTRRREELHPAGEVIDLSGLLDVIRDHPDDIDEDEGEREDRRRSKP